MVGVRGADVRFLLSRRPDSATTWSDDLAVVDALRGSGIHVTENDPDLIVAPPSKAGRLAASNARAGVLDGWPARTRALRSHGWNTQRYLHVAGPDGPVLYATNTPAVRRYLARCWSRPTARLGRLRNRVLQTPAGSLAANSVVATRHPGLPYPLAVGLGSDVISRVSGWLFSMRRGDDLQRIVVLVFCDGADTPSYAVKFSRAPGGPLRGPTEEQILARLEALAPDLAARTPRVDFVGELDGAELTVERAGTGSSLTGWLQTTPRDTAVSMAERILDWVAEIARSTAQSPGRADLELPPGFDPPARGVLTHQDLGSWNILTDGETFTVLDWESARWPGLPLADACYFATDVLAELDGPVHTADRPAWCADLWAGALPASPLLRRWVTRAAYAADVAPELIGPLASACWLGHASSQQRRAKFAEDGTVGYGYLGRFGSVWATDPRLGVRWEGFPP